MGEIGPLRDLFAARGFLVFEPNYRGSDNLGNAHEHATYRHPGAGPDSDVNSGLKMLEARGIVDSSRIAAVGHSYGGYMTAWLISHQHFWRCAWWPTARWTGPRSMSFQARCIMR